jgi:hypothetical protein
MNVPAEWKHVAFWTSVVVAGLNAALEQPDHTPVWRMISHIAIAVLPLVFVKALHNDNAAAIVKMKNGSNGVQGEAH